MKYTQAMIDDPESCCCCDGVGKYWGPDKLGRCRVLKCGACKSTGRIQSPRPRSKKASIKLANVAD